MLAYDSFAARVCTSLPPGTSDREDFASLVMFVHRLGGNKNGLVDQLLNFGSLLVNSKKTKIRWSAFGILNKIDATASQTILAVLYKTYIQMPDTTTQYVPDPAGGWSSANSHPAWLEACEQTLRYVNQAEVRALLEETLETNGTIPPETQLCVRQTDIATHVVEAFEDVAFKNKNACNTERIRSALKEAAQEALKDYGIAPGRLPKPPLNMEWLNMVQESEEENGQSSKQPKPKGRPKGSKKQKAKASTTPSPSVPPGVEKDLATFSLNKSTKKPENKGIVRLPWKEWHLTPHFADACLEGAVISAAKVALRELQMTIDVGEWPIEIVLDNNRVKVLATKNIRPKELMIPPHATQSWKIATFTEHPAATRVLVEVKPVSEEERGTAAADHARETHVATACARVVRADDIEHAAVNEPSPKTCCSWRQHDGDDVSHLHATECGQLDTHTQPTHDLYRSGIKVCDILIEKQTTTPESIQREWIVTNIDGDLLHISSPRRAEDGRQMRNKWDTDIVSLDKVESHFHVVHRNFEGADMQYEAATLHEQVLAAVAEPPPKKKARFTHECSQRSVELYMTPDFTLPVRANEHRTDPP